MARFSVVAILALCPASFLPLRGESPKLHIPRVSQPPALDDYRAGEDPAGIEVTGFRQWRPGDGDPVSEETSAYLSYDDSHLYVVFVCKDAPGQVRARMSRREDIDSDDQVVLNLDTFHDHQRAYTFAANPLGIQQDFIFTEGQAPDLNFDTLWHSEGKLVEDGYIVRMAIPFRSLRFPNRPVQQWGIGLGRSIVRKNEFSTWPYVTQRIESFLQQLGDLEGLERISPGRNLQFIPYAAFARARFLDPRALAYRTENEFRAGLDAKVVMRDALTLDVTLNPDFSQVESDDPQVTVNQRYEVYFPEKRPFFIENAGFFETPINAEGFFEPAVSLFFTRRIVEPQFGARVTGKVGSWVIGALASDDRAPGRTPSPSGSPQDGRAGIVVARVRRDFGGQSSAGALVTSRDLGPDSNRVVSADTRLRLNPNWILSGQAARSYTASPDGRLTGPAYYARLDHSGRHCRYFGRYLDFSPDFRADLGFIRRTDIRQTEHFVAYRWWREQRWLLSIEPAAAALVNWDRQGHVQDWVAGAGFIAEFPGQSELSAGRDESFELYQGLRFRKNSMGAAFKTEWLPWLTLQADYGRAKRINYYPPAGTAPSSARACFPTPGWWPWNAPSALGRTSL